jgi:hypothetical protein
MALTFTTPQSDLLNAIIQYCEQHGVTETSFGKRAVGDPNLVRDMKAGRELRSSTVNKVMQAISQAPEANQ